MTSLKGVGVPVKLLHEAVGHTVSVRLRCDTCRLHCDTCDVICGVDQNIDSVRVCVVAVLLACIALAACGIAMVSYAEYAHITGV